MKRAKLSGSLLAPLVPALALAMPASATVVPFTGTVSITFQGIGIGGNTLFVGTGGGTAFVNNSAGGHPISTLAAILRRGEFASATGGSISITAFVGHPILTQEISSLSSRLALVGSFGPNNLFYISGNFPITTTSRSTNSGSTFATDTFVFVAPVSLQFMGFPASGVVTMTIHLIPEPATLVLLGVGIVGLIAYGRRRRRG